MKNLELNEIVENMRETVKRFDIINERTPVMCDYCGKEITRKQINARAFGSSKHYAKGGKIWWFELSAKKWETLGFETENRPDLHKKCFFKLKLEYHRDRARYLDEIYEWWAKEVGDS